MSKEAGRFLGAPESYTQDQLQGMVPNLETPEDLLSTLFYWAQKYNSDRHGGEIAQSMEQLSISFVMHELHGKRWDGSEWIDNGQNGTGERHMIETIDTGGHSPPVYVDEIPKPQGMNRWCPFCGINFDAMYYTNIIRHINECEGPE